MIKFIILFLYIYSQFEDPRNLYGLLIYIIDKIRPVRVNQTPQYGTTRPSSTSEGGVSTYDGGGGGGPRTGTNTIKKNLKKIFIA